MTHEVSIVVRFSVGGDIEVETTSEGMRTLARVVAGPAESTLIETLASVDPAPYDGLAHHIEVKDAPGKVRLVLVHGHIVISGDGNARQLLADSLVALADEGVGAHLHVEYFPDHFFLDSSCQPSVFAVVDRQRGSD